MGKIKCLNCGTELTMITNAACPTCGVRLSHVKIAFLAYLGPEDNLTGYQRSYKLVLLKSIFEELLVGNTLKVKTVTDRFKSYYLRRKLHGLLVDKNVDSRITNIDSSSTEDVFEVIKANPYNAIHKKGFLRIDELSGVYVLQRGIDDLSSSEIRGLLDLIRKKLQLYYQKIGSESLTDDPDLPVFIMQEKESNIAFAEKAEKDNHEGTELSTELEINPIRPLLSTYSLEDLHLSNRAYNSLRRNGIHTAEALVEAVLSGGISSLKNIGAHTVTELSSIVEKLNNGSLPAPAVKTTVVSEDSIESLSLSNRAYNALTHNGVHTIEALVNAVLSGEVRSFRNIGATTTAELTEVVEMLIKENHPSTVPPSPNTNEKQGESVPAPPVDIKIDTSFLDKYAKSRDFDAYLQRADGDTLQAVADVFNLTRERVRQICARFERHAGLTVTAVCKKLFLHNSAKYFTEEQVYSVFNNDSYGKAISTVMKNSPLLTYLDFAKVFVDRREFPSAEETLKQIASEIVGEGINLFEKLTDIEARLADAGYTFITADAFLNLLIKYNYKCYGDYVLQTRKSYGVLGAEVVADEFPSGIHTNSDEEINHLRTLLESKYGKLDLPANNRSFMTRICSFLIQAGRSTYISPKNIAVDDSILLDIKAYIDSQAQQDIYYNLLFAEYEGILTMTSNVDNPGFLHGVLAWRFPDDYIYSRDYLRKLTPSKAISLAEQIHDLLTEAGRPMTKGELVTHFPGLTDAMFNNIFYSSANLIQWEYGVYNCADNLKVDSVEKTSLKTIIQRLLYNFDGYCTQDILYRAITHSLPDFCIRNQVTAAQNIFYIAAHFFSDVFAFNRPHIAFKGRFKSLDAKTIALDLLGYPTILKADEYHTLVNTYEWPEVTASMVFYDIEKDYVRLDKDTYQKTSAFQLSNEDISYIKGILPSSSDDWYLSLQCFEDTEDCLPSGLPINEFLMHSIIEKYDFGWCIVQPQSRNRRYEKGILVRNEKDISAYDQLIARILSDAGIKTISASSLLSFLQIHQLTHKVIPKELEISECFSVSNDQFTLV